MLKKIDNLKENINKNIDLLSCPICNARFNLFNYSLKCTNNHSFDLSKKGYVNFLSSNVKEDYDKTLFDARNEIIKCGFFKPLTDKLAILISENKNILDAGCGEGSHLKSIFENIPNNNYFGIDISKDAIKIAGENKELNFFVGDLAKLPFLENSFDYILNIFSPSNYKEFKRILKSDGRIIKVIPTKNYLKELREHFKINEDYSNEKIISHFKESFPNSTEEILSYTFDVKDNLQNLIYMTPLTKNIDEELKYEFIKNKKAVITVEVILLKNNF